MQFFSATLRGWVNPADAFVLLHEKSEHAFWLDRESHPSSRFSVIGASTKVIEASDLDEIQAYLAEHSRVTDDLELPFEWRPGLVGVVEFEGLSRFIQVDRAMVFDHDQRAMYFVGHFESRFAFELWHHAGLLRLGLAGGQVAHYLHRNRDYSVAGNPTVRHSSEAYLDLIESAQQSIRAGDVYQLCLTNQIQIQSTIDPLTAFLLVRKQNPAPYSAYLRFADRAIVSISPEQFLRVSADGIISSKPIKGTRRRDENPKLDELMAEELKNNAKERAENLMIVDLMRNDFAQVSEPESVTVESLFEVESYSTVHQLVSTVTAKLASDSSAVDAFRACFPGGSMTGAPKPMAIKLIGQLEGGPRGIYSGALGYLGVDGSAEFGMVIRTMVFEKSGFGQQISIGVGGGITIDSDPQAELEETKLKSAALLSALGVASPWG